MKRSFSILLITALLVALMPLMSTVALAEEYATITSENGYGVRLREGPSKAYNPLGTFDVGTTVVVLQRGDEWSQLQIGDTVGWMLNKYLVFGTTGTTGATVSTANAVVYSSNGLRVWLRATAGGTRLFLNSPGTAVTVLDYGDEWCRVSVNGTIGYMMTKYLTMEKIDPADYQIESATINYYYPVVGDTLSVAVEPSAATVTYEWYVDGELLGTESTFEVLTRYANQTIKVKVTGTGSYYGSAVDTVYPVQINRSLKSVSLSQSVPVVGEKLEAVLQPTSASVDYSWRVGGVEVSSEAAYTPTADDIGKLIQLKVTGIDGFSGSAACTAKSVVISDKVVQYVELSNKYPIVGEVLTASVYPSSADVNITWYADGEAVAYVSSYEVNKRDLGKKIQVVAEGVDPYSGTATATTANVASSEITGVFITEESPLVGDWITALIKPSTATAYYYWYTDDNILIAQGQSSSLELTDSLVDKYDLVGKKIWVSAVGTGVYTGAVYSSQSGEVIDYKVITAVAIDNTTPVVGDVLTVSVEPRSRDPFFENDLTYIWYADTETKTEHGSSYTVQYSDIDKRIRVKVIGANGYSGEAYSTYTGKVAEYGYLTAAKIYNGSTGEYATSVSPEVGHTLYASVSPTGGNDSVTYTWSVGGKTVEADDADGDSLTIKKEWTNQQITLTATGTDCYAYGKPVTAMTKKVVYRDALNAAMWIDAPEVGVAPSSSAYCYDSDYGFDECTASVNWLNSNYETAVLDVYGCFLPGTEYIAQVTVQPKDKNLTLFGANVQFYSDGTIASSTQAEDGSSTYYVTFGATAAQSVTDYYIADLDAPVVGGEMDSTCSNDQVVGSVTWSYTEDVYTACIELQTYLGYTLDGVPDNAFTVAGADKTLYTAGSNVIWAIFNVDHELTIQMDKDAVYLDGYNRRIVQCSALLSNYMGKLENIKWEIVDARVDGTSINENGQLVIGMYEETERQMTVRATVTVGSKEYVAEKAVSIYSGTDTNTALKVIFTKYNSEITRGGRGYFETVVSNSSDGCKLFALYEDGTSKQITDGWLYIPTNMDDEYVIVKGISNEDHSVVCTMLVTLTGDITDPSTDTNAPKVEFTKSYAVVELGSTVTYEAKSIGTVKDDCVIYVTWPNGDMEVLKNGALKVDADEKAENVTVTAYSTEDPMLSTSMNVTIVPAANVTFTKGPDKVERGKSYDYEAIARYLAQNVECTLYADFGGGQVKLEGGKLNVAADEKAASVTITAVCTKDTSITGSKTITIYPARSIEFVKSENVVSRGGYAYTFAATATVFGTAKECDIYADFGDGETKLDGGKLVVDAAETADSVTVTAKYTCDDGEELTRSMNVAIKDKSYIEFTSSATSVEHGDEVTYKAVAYIDDEILDCDIYAIWDDGTQEKLTNGVLKVSETETETHLRIKAVYAQGQPTEMSTSLNVTIKPDAYIAFADGLPTQIKRSGEAYYSANAVFKNTTDPADIYADYNDGNGYVALPGGKLEGSKAAGASVSIMAAYDGIASEYMTVTITDLPKITFTKSASKVERGTTAEFAASATVDGTSYACDIYVVDSDGTETKLEGGLLTVAEEDAREMLLIRARYLMSDGTTELTANTEVTLFTAKKVLSMSWKDSHLSVERGGEYTFAAEALLDDKTTEACDIYVNGALMKDGKYTVSATETAATLTVKAVYNDEYLSKTVNVYDKSTIAFTQFTDSIAPGGSAIYKAVAKVAGKDHPCTIVASFGDISKTLPESGKLKYSDLIWIPTKDVTVTLTASYKDEASGIALSTQKNVTFTRFGALSTLDESSEPVEITMEGELPVVAEVLPEISVIDMLPEGPTAGDATLEPEAAETTEEPATEPEEVPETIVIDVDTTEPATEEVETEPEEVPETIVIDVDTTEPATEEAETEPEEVPETIVIVVDTTEPVEETAESEPAEETKPAEKAESKAEQEVSEAEETAENEEEDETLDALEGDDIGESAQSESPIKISFTKHANKIRLGNYSTYKVNVTGSDQGVIWSLRLSADVNGDPVSSIDQDGRLTISLDETAEKLIVVATSREDRSVRARWIVEVTDEEVAAADEAETEETVTVGDETMTDEDAMAEAAMAEENKGEEEPAQEPAEIEEELVKVEEGGSLLDMF